MYSQGCGGSSPLIRTKNSRDHEGSVSDDRPFRIRLSAPFIASIIRGRYVPLRSDWTAGRDGLCSTQRPVQAEASRRGGQGASRTRTAVFRPARQRAVPPGGGAGGRGYEGLLLQG